jgi:hypothetical protein
MLRITLRDVFWLVVVALIVSLWAFSGQIASRSNHLEAKPAPEVPTTPPLADLEPQTERDVVEQQPLDPPASDEPQPPVQFGGATGSVREIKLSPDGRFLLSCPGGPNADGTIRLWDIASGKPLQALQALSSQVAGIGYTPAGDKAVSISTGTIQVWDLTTGKEIARQLVGESPECFDIAPHEPIAAIGLTSGDVVIWDYAAGIEKSRLRGHSEPVTAVIFSPAGERLITAAADGTLRLWSVTTGEPLIGRSSPLIDISAEEINVSQAERELTAARLAREEYLNGKFVEEEKLAQWGVLRAEQNLRKAEREVEAIQGLFSKGVVTKRHVEAAQGTVKTARQYLETRQENLETLRKSTKAKTLLQSDSAIAGAEARLVEASKRLADQRAQLGPICFAKLPAVIGAVARSFNGKRIALIQNSDIVVFDAHTGDIRQTFSTGAQNMTCLTFTPSGRHLLAAGNDQVVSQWDVRTGELVAEHRMPDASISSIAVSGDGRYFFTASADDKAWIGIWRLDESESRDAKGVRIDH